MTTQERFTAVLEKIIVPHFVELEDVIVQKLGLTAGEYYRVTYFTNQDLNRKDMVDIIEQTTSLFRMISPDNVESNDLFVDFDNLNDGPDVE
jgi:hypothetical protein